MTRSIYADNAATSFPKPGEVIRAVGKAMTEYAASPGRSAHAHSLKASRIVFEAREAMADLLGVDDSSRIVFTLNVTQAVNTVLYTLLKPGDHVLTTSVEHNSVMRPLMHLWRTRGIVLDVVNADHQGRLEPADFKNSVRPDTKLAVVTHASNAVGTISPARQIKSALGGIPLLLDAAQTGGILPMAPAGHLADIIAFTGHKGLMGPTGTGGLWVRPGLDLTPFVRGGTGSRSELEDHPAFMPDCLEAGTPNTHGLAGLEAGIRFVLSAGLDNIRAHEIQLTNRFLEGLEQIPEITVYGPVEPENRMAVISLNLAGWSPSDLARILDAEFGIMTRAGLHCAPRAHKTMGTFPQGTVRFSFGWFNTEADVDSILNALAELARRNR